MADTFRKIRTELEARFEAGDIPEARHFKELIHSSFNQEEDGIRKEGDTPLEVQAPNPAANDELKDLIQFYDKFSNGVPDWRISLANLTPASGEDQITGLAFSDGDTKADIRLFIRDGGKVGIGTTNPTNELEVKGTLKATTLSGLISPTTGQGADKGILFPNVPSGGADHTAYIRYFAQAGQFGQPAGTVLEFNVSNAGHDHIALMATGNVGVKTLNPQSALDVDGDINLTGDVIIPGPKQMRFKDTNLSDSLKLQLRTGYGLGAKAGELFYKATGKYSWQATDGGERMVLTTVPDGGLTVKGAGLSTFDGSLLVKKTLTVEQAVTAQAFSGLIQPTSGETDATGIRFGPDAGSKAQLRYFTPPGESNRNLEIRVSGASSDKIVLKTAGGNVKIETSNPAAKLEVDSNMQLSGSIALPGTQKIQFTGSNFSSGLNVELPSGVGLGAGNNLLSYSARHHVWKDRDTGNMGMVLDTVASGVLQVTTGLSFFSGSAVIGQNLQVGGEVTARKFNGFIQPTAGNEADDGIQFPPDPGGGSSDRAYIRYYSRSGENMTLEIGTTNDPQDHIVLKSSGNVGINVAEPASKLEVAGSIKGTSVHADGALSGHRLSLDGVSIGVDELRALISLARGNAYVGVGFSFGFDLLFSYHYRLNTASKVIIPR